VTLPLGSTTNRPGHISKPGQGSDRGSGSSPGQSALPQLPVRAIPGCHRSRCGTGV
jgi:hypothetical protein